MRVVWSKAWGGTGWDYGDDITADRFGNYYFVAGVSSTDGDLSGYDFSSNWLVKMGSDGQILWQRSIPMDKYGRMGKVIGDADGGVVAGGASNISLVDVVKYDETGHLLWKT